MRRLSVIAAAALAVFYFTATPARAEPVKLSIGIVRGLPQMGANTFTTTPAAPKEPDANIPRWFTRMDANGDGTISRREFLGTSEQFEELDLDGDQFVDSDELRQPDTSGKSATSGT